MAKNKKRTPRYSKAEKHAYYVGMGVGLTANGYGTGLTQRAFRMMSDKEKNLILKVMKRVIIIQRFNQALEVTSEVYFSYV